MYLRSLLIQCGSLAVVADCNSQLTDHLMASLDLATDSKREQWSEDSEGSVRSWQRELKICVTLCIEALPPPLTECMGVDIWSLIFK